MIHHTDVVVGPKAKSGCFGGLSQLWSKVKMSKVKMSKNKNVENKNDGEGEDV
jgi:hypothetical protein